MAVFSQLKDLAFAGDYSEVGKPKRNLQSFTFIFFILVSTPAFFNLDPSLLTLTFVKSDQMMHQGLKTTEVNTFKVEEGFVKTGGVITKAREDSIPKGSRERHVRFGNV